jgi:uncharacterized protein with von Willebrand factor type A (vWA) domain
VPGSFRYSRWDGTQKGFELDADDLLAELTDDLLYHGELDAALRRLLQDGVRDADGNRLAGLRELIERLRQRRKEELAKHDLGGVYDDIARALRDVVETERAAIDDLDRQAQESGDARRQDITGQAMAERRMELDLLPPDLAGQVKALEAYDFVSPAAAQAFQELMDDLRQQLLDSQFQQMAGAMESTTPEEMARFKDMLSALNTMLDERARGEEPDFEGFMAQYGDLFPENPQTLDELLESMARRMAAMQAFLNSLTPEQRAQLSALSAQLLDDMDLRWQVDRLQQHLQSAFPGEGWDRRFQTRGRDSLGMAGAVDLMERLGNLDQLENLLSSAPSPGALAEVDFDVARDLLGDDGARSLERLAELAQMLTDAGLIENREGRLELTPRGLRAIGRNALGDLFQGLEKDRVGRHALEREGPGHERSYSTKPYEWGDPFNLDIQRTLRNAVTRAGTGTPVRLEPDDFEVERTETLTRSSTVLLLDLSLSMPMKDNFLAAKKVAIALHSLISTQYPRDFLGLVVFGEVARTLRPAELPRVSWDFNFGTNIQHALLLARQMLSRQPGTRQVMMITDGEPTAHILPSGIPFFSYPPAPETLRATLAEVARCTAENIRINTFMLDATPDLQAFVERMAKLNRGRIFFTTPENLGSYVLVDFLDQKRARRGRPTPRTGDGYRP